MARYSSNLHWSEQARRRRAILTVGGLAVGGFVIGIIFSVVTDFLRPASTREGARMSSAGHVPIYATPAPFTAAAPWSRRAHPDHYLHAMAPARSRCPLTPTGGAEPPMAAVAAQSFRRRKWQEQKRPTTGCEKSCRFVGGAKDPASWAAIRKKPGGLGAPGLA